MLFDFVHNYIPAAPPYYHSLRYHQAKSTPALTLTEAYMTLITSQRHHTQPELSSHQGEFTSAVSSTLLNAERQLPTSTAHSFWSRDLPCGRDHNREYSRAKFTPIQTFTKACMTLISSQRHHTQLNLSSQQGEFTSAPSSRLSSA